MSKLSDGKPTAEDGEPGKSEAPESEPGRREVLKTVITAGVVGAAATAAFLGGEAEAEAAGERPPINEVRLEAAEVILQGGDAAAGRTLTIRGLPASFTPGDAEQRIRQVLQTLAVPVGTIFRLRITSSTSLVR
jgi:hypothetical protein